MLCSICEIKTDRETLCARCTLKIQEMLYTTDGFGYLTAMACCINLPRVVASAQNATAMTIAGVLPIITNPKEIKEQASGVVKSIVESAKAESQKKKAKALASGKCINCNESIPVGGLKMTGPNGEIFFSAICKDCGPIVKAKAQKLMADFKKPLNTPQELSKFELESLISSCIETLYPPEDQDHSWSPDTIEKIAALLRQHNLIE